MAHSLTAEEASVGDITCSTCRYLLSGSHGLVMVGDSFTCHICKREWVLRYSQVPRTDFDLSDGLNPVTDTVIKEA